MRCAGGSLIVFTPPTAPAAPQPTGIVSAFVPPLLDETDDIRTFRMAGPTGPGLELAGRVSHLGGDRRAVPSARSPKRAPNRKSKRRTKNERRQEC